MKPEPWYRRLRWRWTLWRWKRGTEPIMIGRPFTVVWWAGGIEKQRLTVVFNRVTFDGYELTLTGETAKTFYTSRRLTK